MHAGVALLPDARPVALLTRHSIRVAADGQGFASYKLPLTEIGRALAEAWGAHICASTGREFRACLSSPIQRCIDTALHMLEGSQRCAELAAEIIETALLVEPGSFVLDASRLGPMFRQYGALKFMNAFLAREMEGVKEPAQGALDILELLYNNLPKQGDSFLLAVSHDTILAAFLAIMHDENWVDPENWPQMMEGVFLWFEGDNFQESHVHWIWRGVKNSRTVLSFYDVLVDTEE